MASTPTKRLTLDAEGHPIPPPEPAVSTPAPSEPCEGEAGEWYAIYTRCRHEAIVARRLQQSGLACYLPLKRVWSTRVDRRKQIDVPAVPGYIFLRCVLSPDIRSMVKRAPGVAALVSSGGQPCRIPASQIRTLQIVLDARADLKEHPAFTAGQLVCIRSGPMKGAIGMLVRTNPDRRRLVIRIDHVGMSFSVDLHEAHVEPVPEAAAG
ncbi:MAG TPA: UpxY family transcription antiterminator [Chthonomonadales bacterium]|nr:UpxY family transcription antiterminator [Chthonomonadales bacterium]